MAYKKRALPRRYRKRSKAKMSRKPKVSLAVKRYVKSTLHKNIENKLYEIQWSQNLGGYSSSATMYAFPLTPYTGGINIAQGVTQGARIGNIIKLRKLVWNFCVSPNTYNATSNPSPQPCYVEVFICSLKGENGVIPNSTDITSFFQLNNNAVPPSGSLYDLTQQVNNDYFICHKRMRIKIGFANYGGTGTNAGLQSFSNNDYSLTVLKKLNVTKYCPKTITFPDATATPSSRCVFALINVMPSIGNTAFSAGVTPIRIDGQIHMEYEDA